MTRAEQEGQPEPTRAAAEQIVARGGIALETGVIVRQRTPTRRRTEQRSGSDDPRRH